MSASSSSLSVSEDSVQRERNCEHQLVVFKLGDEEFGVDIMQVREIIKKENITVVPNAPDFVRGVINLRGQITTIIDLKRKLGISSQESTDSRQERIIVVETGNNVVGMAVDAVTEVTYLSDKDIEEVPPIIKENMQTKYLRGVGKLPDRLLILIDLKEVLNDNEREMREIIQ
ncbi:MAG: chemotaxis protein CheW [Canidatus Methanoxibalbensis ujae]|nr:chemotaxis protein CheW [Candidatus Methanoxibalbensis ujae]